MPRATILILEVDDQTVSRLQNILHEANFEVLAASNFREAFEMIRSNAKHLALVIFNFELATDDVDVLARTRKLDFERPIPILLLGEVPLTAEEGNQVALDSGYSGYIYKSMPDAELLSTVAERALKDPERRFGKRVYHQSRALCTVGEQHYAAEIYTLGEGGAFCRCREPLPEVGKRGRLRFNGALEGERVLDLQMEVLYHRTTDPKVMSIHPAGFGVRFEKMTPEEEQTLMTLMEQLVEREKSLRKKT